MFQILQTTELMSNAHCYYFFNKTNKQIWLSVYIWEVSKGMEDRQKGSFVISSIGYDTSQQYMIIKCIGKRPEGGKGNVALSQQSIIVCVIYTWIKYV